MNFTDKSNLRLAQYIESMICCHRIYPSLYQTSMIIIKFMYTQLISLVLMTVSTHISMNHYTYRHMHGCIS